MTSFDRDPEEEAQRRGCVVVRPKPNELFVDIDNQEGLNAFHFTLEIFNRESTAPITFSSTPSSSGEPFHFHMVVTWPTPIVDPFQRLGLQAILGSDRIREALGWLRAARGDDDSSVFFEKAPAPEVTP